MDATSLATLSPLAVSIGEAWTQELADTLRSGDREVAGGWPGTLREARMRLLARLPHKLEVETIADLARVVNVAARRRWLAICQPDPEP